MAARQKKPIIVFDVNETLLDITTLEPLFERVFGHSAVMREWFAQLILYSQTMTLCGRYQPFGELAVGTLNMLASIHGKQITTDDVDEFKQLMGAMPAHADVEPALKTLQAENFRLVTLSNSAGGADPSPLQKAGLADYFEGSFSVDAVKKFKPAPQTYQLVADELGVQTHDLLLVACHLWDTAGAQAAGCHGAFLTRPYNAVLPAEGIPKADFVASDLGELVSQVIGRWGNA